MNLAKHFDFLSVKQYRRRIKSSKQEIWESNLNFSGKLLYFRKIKICLFENEKKTIVLHLRFNEGPTELPKHINRRCYLKHGKCSDDNLAPHGYCNFRDTFIHCSNFAIPVKFIREAQPCCSLLTANGKITILISSLVERVKWLSQTGNYTHSWRLSVTLLLNLWFL